MLRQSGMKSSHCKARHGWEQLLETCSQGTFSHLWGCSCRRHEPMQWCHCIMPWALHKSCEHLASGSSPRQTHKARAMARSPSARRAEPGFTPQTLVTISAPFYMEDDLFRWVSALFSEYHSWRLSDFRQTPSYCFGISIPYAILFPSGFCPNLIN